MAEALDVDGVDICVIYGPEFDMWVEGIDPELQAAMARAYNRWGAEMREQLGRARHHLGPDPAERRRPGRSTRSATPTSTWGSGAFWTRPDRFNRRTLGDRYYDPI